MGLFSRSNDAAISAQLARLERKVDALLAHLRILSPNDGLDDIRDLIRSGNKIAAISAYRARTGVGLKDAKDAIERGL